MNQQIIQLLLLYVFVYVLAFDDFIYVYGQGNKEMTESGRIQYQLLKERSNLPKYGPCWKLALQTLDEGCRNLSEETQSDIALHFTNCFLEMSGHETYSCVLDKNPTSRAICISGMSDRAFSVYTEFYAQTQNTCWFLRGQIWHEAITKSTIKVIKQLEITANNEDDLLKAQKESLKLQEKIIKHGKILEQVLEDLYISSQTHRDSLKLLSQSIAYLQSWIVGEVSWIDSLIFYIVTYLFLCALTSTEKTMVARLPTTVLLLITFFVERIIYFLISYEDTFGARNYSVSIYNTIWYLRYVFVFTASLLFLYTIILHKSNSAHKFELLYKIADQNSKILEILEHTKFKNGLEKPSYLNEREGKLIEMKLNGESKSLIKNSFSNSQFIKKNNNIANLNP